MTMLFNSSPQRVENNVINKKPYRTIWSLSWFVFARYRVLSDIIKQVIRQWRCCSIHHRSASQTMLSVKSFIVQSGREWDVVESALTPRGRHSQIWDGLFRKNHIKRNLDPQHCQVICVFCQQGSWYVFSRIRDMYRKFNKFLLCR